MLLYQPETIKITLQTGQGRRGRDSIVVEFTTTCAISAYQA
jgi:hypothetical protein